ncbi:hypothetical protein D917_00440 [Trichinella nativa]|uniref:Integrase catalytic domain-containing protein n=1 Tax=Trichinella nativa TaxID=6335 RepID=A0A1Y3EBT6_9BILA|nr:hypothetical protein D917_00440 [Trichinella nativa]
MSNNLKTYLHSLGVVTSRTTTRNPQGNGEAERYNGIMWKADKRYTRYARCGRVQLTLLLMSIYLVTRVEHLRVHPSLLEEVELLEANPKYAHVRLTYGRESVRHLAPAGGKCVAENGSPDETQVGTGAPREEGEKAEKPDANDVIPENSENEEDTAT